MVNLHASEQEIDYRNYIMSLIRPFDSKDEKTNLVKVFRILLDTYQIKNNLFKEIEHSILNNQTEITEKQIKLNENKFGDLIHIMGQGEFFGENFIGKN